MTVEYRFRPGPYVPRPYDPADWVEDTYDTRDADYQFTQHPKGIPMLTVQTADLLVQLIDRATVSPGDPNAVQVLTALQAARAEVIAAVQPVEPDTGEADG